MIIDIASKQVRENQEHVEKTKDMPAVSQILVRYGP